MLRRLKTFLVIAFLLVLCGTPPLAFLAFAVWLIKLIWNHT